MLRERRLVALALLCVAWAAAPPAAAHGPDPAPGALEPRLDPLPPELAGVVVQLRSTLGAQLVVENRGEQALEILDDQGVAFLHIAPTGVQANLATPAWYQSLGPEGALVPADVLAAAAAGEPVENRWVAIQRRPSWGWFDGRLDAEGRAGGERWEISVRIGDTKTALRGHFAQAAPPQGTLRARMTSESELAPGVRVSLLPGQAGSFFLKSDAPAPVTVLGRDGEPFLRIGPDGVDANLRSPTFAEAARVRGGTGLALDPRADGAPSWKRIGDAPSYAWVDPRTAWLGAVPAAVIEAGAAAELLRWSVPVRIGAGDDAKRVQIEGVTLWQPLPTGHAQKEPGRAS